MRICLLYLLFVSTAMPCILQKTIDGALKRLNSGSVPYISVPELEISSPILLDTRKKEEYQVSHIEGAIWTGFKTFTLDSLQHQVPDKEAPIVVYCSIGVRSEQIGEKLRKAGYSNVKNLYGGIFEWKNQGNPVVDSMGRPTEEVHAFDKHWGKLLTNAKKVYHTKPERIENQP